MTDQNTEGKANRYSPEALEGLTLQGCYRVEKRIAKGGMAWIYRATHTGLNEPVALKILMSALAEEPMIRQRFLNEARIQFKLKHPHIVRVTDVIEEGGIFGMVLEWVEGEDLELWLRQFSGKLPYEKLWEVFSPVLEALDTIHQEGFVHRDLKPANIMLAQAGERVVPKVADFGIAKIAATLGPSMTKTGTYMGTLKYMSPEQIHDSRTVDQRADIYSLGIILYEMVTGSVPFSGEVATVLLKQISTAPVPPRQLRKDIPPQLEKLILQCLEKKPQRRPQSCAELYQRLGIVLEKAGYIDFTSHHAPTLSWEETRTPSPPWLTTLLLVLLLFAATGGIALWRRHVSRQTPSIPPISRGPLPRTLQPPLQSEPRTFTIESAPAGAIVWLDGQRRGMTPYKIQGKSGQTLQFSLRLDGYQELLISWTLTEKPHQYKLYTLQPLSIPRLVPQAYRPMPKRRRIRPSRTRRIIAHRKTPTVRQLPPAALPASLWIRSDPSGAWVSREGQRLGQTPLRIPGRVGQSIQLTLTKERFEPLKIRWNPRSGQHEQKTWRLKPALPSGPFD